MADLAAQAAKQLENILSSTGKTLEDFTRAVGAAGHEKHGKMVAFFKKEFGLGHGNANLLAHTIRQNKAGGPPPAVDLLAAQYSGKKAPLKQIYDRLAAIALARGADVTQVIQKTGVSFRRARQFALVQAPSTRRVALGLNLDETPDDPRIKEKGGMCTHEVNLTEAAAVDETIEAWIEAAYQRAG